MSYYYLDVSLEFRDGEVNHVTSPAYYKKQIVQCMNKVFGETASQVPIDIIKYNPDKYRSIIRIPANYYVKLRAALTLCGSYESKQCAYRIHKTSDLLITLCADSRDFEH